MTLTPLQKAISYMIAASFCFAVTGAMARILREEFSSVQLVLFRNIIGLPILLFMLYSGAQINQKGGRPLLLIMRGIIGTLALYFFFYGVTTIGLAESITYQQSYPILLAFVGAVFLHQEIQISGWLAIILGFIGICCVFIPKMSASALELRSHILGIFNLLLTASAYLSIYGLSAYYDKRIIVLSFMTCGIIMPVLSMIGGHYMGISQMEYLFSVYKSPALIDMIYIIPLGLFALIGQLFLTKAFSYKNTGLVGAMGFSNVVFSIALGILLGDEIPGMYSIIGIVAIIISGIIISLQKDYQTDDKE